MNTFPLGKRVTLLIPHPGMNTAALVRTLCEAHGTEAIVFLPHHDAAFRMSTPEARRVDEWLSQIFPEKKGSLAFNTDYGYPADLAAHDYQLVKVLLSRIIWWPTAGTIIAIDSVFERLHPTTQVLLLHLLLSFVEYPLLICSHSSYVRMELNTLATAGGYSLERPSDTALHAVCQEEAPRHAWLFPGDLAAYSYLNSPPANILDADTQMIDSACADGTDELLSYRFNRIYECMVKQYQSQGR
jgi:hypothetical protein